MEFILLSMSTAEYLSLTFNSPHLLVLRDLSRRVFYSGMNSSKPRGSKGTAMFFKKITKYLDLE